MESRDWTQAQYDDSNWIQGYPSHPSCKAAWNTWWKKENLQAKVNKVSNGTDIQPVWYPDCLKLGSTNYYRLVIPAKRIENSDSMTNNNNAAMYSANNNYNALATKTIDTKKDPFTFGNNANNINVALKNNARLSTACSKTGAFAVPTANNFAANNNARTTTSCSKKAVPTANNFAANNNARFAANNNAGSSKSCSKKSVPTANNFAANNNARFAANNNAASSKSCSKTRTANNFANNNARTTTSCSKKALHTAYNFEGNNNARSSKSCSKSKTVRVADNFENNMRTTKACTKTRATTTSCTKAKTTTTCTKSRTVPAAVYFVATSTRTARATQTSNVTAPFILAPIKKHSNSTLLAAALAALLMTILALLCCLPCTRKRIAAAGQKQANMTETGYPSKPRGLAAPAPFDEDSAPAPFDEDAPRSVFSAPKASQYNDMEYESYGILIKSYFLEPNVFSDESAIDRYAGDNYQRDMDSDAQNKGADHSAYDVSEGLDHYGSSNVDNYANDSAYKSAQNAVQSATDYSKDSAGYENDAFDDKLRAASSVLDEERQSASMDSAKNGSAPSFFKNILGAFASNAVKPKAQEHSSSHNEYETETSYADMENGKNNAHNASKSLAEDGLYPLRAAASAQNQEQAANKAADSTQEMYEYEREQDVSQFEKAMANKNSYYSDMAQSSNASADVESQNGNAQSSNGIFHSIMNTFSGAPVKKAEMKSRAAELSEESYEYQTEQSVSEYETQKANASRDSYDASGSQAGISSQDNYEEDEVKELSLYEQIQANNRTRAEGRTLFPGSKASKYAAASSNGAAQKAKGYTMNEMDEEIYHEEDVDYSWRNVPVQRPAPSSHIVSKAYTATRPDEISLQVGDIIGIETIFEDGWARAQNISQGGKRCMVPMNFISYIKTGPSQNVVNGNTAPMQFDKRDSHISVFDDVVPSRVDSKRRSMRNSVASQISN
jgi:hypothetical protein